MGYIVLMPVTCTPYLHLRGVVHRQILQPRNFIDAVIPRENKRHNSGAACDVEMIILC